MTTLCRSTALAINWSMGSVRRFLDRIFNSKPDGTYMVYLDEFDHSIALGIYQEVLGMPNQANIEKRYKNWPMQAPNTSNSNLHHRFPISLFPSQISDSCDAPYQLELKLENGTKSLIIGYEVGGEA